MRCKNCGSKNVVKDGEVYKCSDCGATAVSADNKKLIKELEKENEKKKSPLRDVLEFLLPIVLALIIALGLKTFVFANAKVPSGSMLDTIQIGDMVIASRLEYQFNDPERYDIVIFKFPDDVAKHEADSSVEVRYFVKRVIGLPGETVSIVNGVVYVEKTDGTTVQVSDEYVTACEPSGDFGPYHVPENCYFVLGDNRNTSDDSRYWTTTNYVDRDLIIGKVKFRYYPSFERLDTEYSDREVSE